jgi:hypothetical protein
MPKPDAERIKWFLNLQQILHFPKYFMAPLIVPRLGNKLTVSPLRTMRRDLPLLQDKPLAARTTHHIAIGTVFPAIKHMTSSTDGVGAATSRRLITTVAPRLLGGPLRWSEPRNTLSVSSKYRSSDEFQRMGASTSREYPGLQKQFRLFHAASAKPVESKNSRPLAPVDNLSPAQDIGMRDPGRFKGPTVADTGGISLGRNRPLANEKPSFKNGHINRNQWGLPIQDGGGDSDQPQRSRSAVSTIHIDGSVLGRWAIQYLEAA